MKAPRNAVPKSKRLLPLGAIALGFAVSPAPSFAQAAKADTTLPTVNVQADADKPDSYRATTTRVGKTVQDPHEIPQAITSVTSALMNEQQVGSLREAMRNVSGLSFNAAEGGRSGDNMNLRSFYTFGDMYLDGVRDTAQYNRETFNYEQIDVLRGAGAMLFGRGQAGGVINQVSKTPMRTEEYKLTGSVGTDNYTEVTADLNKPFNQQTALRVNLMKRDEGSWRSNPATGTEPEIHRKGIAASLGMNLHTNNQFWVNYYQLETNDNPDYGNPFDTATRKPTTAFAPETFWGSDLNFDKSKTQITTLVNEYHFSGGGDLRTQLRSANYERSYWARTPSLTSPPNAQSLVLNGTTANGGPTRVADYETLTLQSDYTNRFKTGDMKHELLVGVEYFNEDSFRHSLQNVGGTTAANPPRYLPYGTATTGAPVSFDSDSYALYVQDTIEFMPRWKATLGARRDELDAQFSSTTSPKLKYGEWSTRAALSFHPSSDTHYYLAHSDSFSPTADLYQLTVKPQPPETSKVLELGAKWMFFEGDLSLRAAVYNAVKDWERNVDLESTSAILTKKRRTNGFELEAAGRINEHWEIFAGMSLMDAKIKEVAENINATTGAITLGNPGWVGQDARNTPAYTFNLWTTYAFGGSLQGWKVGGGVEAKDERYGFNPSGAGALPTLPGSTAYYPNTAPAYERWDAMVSYDAKNWSVRLNVKNVFDKVYYDSLYDNGGFAIPGLRRQAILSGEFKF